jgi:hypothetical protein
MATVQQRAPRSNLPGREIKPFPARSASYRALSIIDAYSSDVPLPDQEQAPAPVLKTIQRLRSKHETINESYASDFDIDEAYGSGEADLNDDMGEIINLDEYDPYRTTTPPPRTSSRKPKVEVKAETVEVKPEPPPKPQNNDNYDPYKPKTPPKQDASENSRGLTSRSEPALARFEDPAIQLAIPPKDVSNAINGSLLTATTSALQLNLITTPNNANKDKALPIVPRKQITISKPVPSTKEETEVKNGKALPGLPKRPDEDLRSRKDSIIQSEKGEYFYFIASTKQKQDNMQQTTENL